MKYQFKIPADRGIIFTERVFDKVVGKITFVENFGRARITAVEIVDNGKAALISIDTINKTVDDTNPGKTKLGTRRGR